MPSSLHIVFLSMIISPRFPLFHDLFDSRQNKGARVKYMAHDQA